MAEACAAEGATVVVMRGGMKLAWVRMTGRLRGL
jgi:hypothetical protein